MTDTAVSILRELLAYEDDRPAEGTKGAEIYARARKLMEQYAPEEPAQPDVDLLSTLNVTVKCPHGTTLDGNSIVLPSGEVLRVRPAFELCDDEQGEYLDLTYYQLTARRVYYEIQRSDVEPDL